MFDYQKHLRMKNILKIGNQEGGKHFLHHQEKYLNYENSALESLELVPNQKQLKHAMIVSKVTSGTSINMGENTKEACSYV